ncbi:NAD-dependent epimerase/dehydratase family protein [Methanococcoides burtonii]|uniref:UDP-galactose-4-epimerase n=1 Tax=Methanococcoides burtonii (strain DSM 6242 / NBRC 107633 / OCM 468 / ACE-M) TaxID=259564 RepID=Q12UH5_METBU|nr:NAD-dependent epimerase/dehydratase family protein [Methanococcoides burtonii]ABE52901.1 UDP-galactose -4-epimerase [Methanococcoides burtonii DSM 6242]
MFENNSVILITGGAGFIGSHVVDKLINIGNRVIVFDNLSSGNLEYIDQHLDNPNFTFINGDLLDTDKITKACHNIDCVYHIAANPDVRLGFSNTKVHFDQNITATYNLLEAMRKNNIRNIVFTSTSTVYGEASIIPTPENYGPLVPISLYGASKLSCEALITSYCHTFNMRSWIFRFANIIGERSTHGIIFDFIKKLHNNPDQLEILGDGQQSKSYLHISACIDAILFVVNKSLDDVNIFNIGSEDTINSTQIGMIVVEEMGLENVEFTYTGGTRGWKGDVPRMSLSIDKLESLGWSLSCSSKGSVIETVRSLLSTI